MSMFDPIASFSHRGVQPASFGLRPAPGEGFAGTGRGEFSPVAFIQVIFALNGCAWLGTVLPVGHARSFRVSRSLDRTGGRAVSAAPLRRDQEFRTTHWSAVLSARDKEPRAMGSNIDI